jgi:hypothetical protein
MPLNDWITNIINAVFVLIPITIAIARGQSKGRRELVLLLGVVPMTLMYVFDILRRIDGTTINLTIFYFVFQHIIVMIFMPWLVALVLAIIAPANAVGENAMQKLANTLIAFSGRNERCG